ncbi:Mur ligase family protein [Parabacteroides sp. PF5-6]|uniref:Mur ligase family protein n=1 Tax=Parabacteroides sp. PF5-6 TaxID=1742403 RepID=UPI002406C778|nr:Mur ligase family protein [Parabacteroides sp. PF5-6]MDF9829275.1 UDP-N-acetylmuramate: L-alanyl-gamma-D-glutamyl-meso-diaminopimelate ligase [Parabacteroides sp. PF5-6]
MRKVHLISVTEPVIFDMSLAIREKGYEVVVSGNGLAESALAQLHAAGCTCYGDGWFPEKMTKDIQIVVLGAKVKKDNPELVRARELGLLIQSVPEFVFDRTKSKIRVVVAGGQGKSSVLSMIGYAMQRSRVSFDYILSGKIDVLPNLVYMGYESRIVLIEGDEHITSAIEKRYQLEFYRPHIAVITNLQWSEEKDHNTPEEYMQTYRDFVTSIEREGKLIFHNEDLRLRELAEKVREDITPIAYERQPLMEKDGTLFLQTRYGNYPVCIPDDYFLLNLSAARLACRQLGMKDADFYQAISDYSLSLKK